jgi:hypothetical protein
MNDVIPQVRYADISPQLIEKSWKGFVILQLVPVRAIMLERGESGSVRNRL